MPDEELPQKNIDKWRYFLSDCPSPNDYINFGFYFMIASALQRKVWVGDELNALYPNIYVVFVGAAGIGKGLVLKQITSCLRHWPYEQHRVTAAPTNLAAPSKEMATYKSVVAVGKKTIAANEEVAELSKAAYEEQAEAVAMTMSLKDQKEYNDKNEKQYLIPCGPDTTTFERLIQKLSESFRRIDYPKSYPDGRPGVGIYGHSSLSVQLEEMGTLFRKKTEDIVTLFQKAYDCGDIEYETISRRKDYVKKCCLNFCAGATPDFMRQVFNDELFNQGISSRGWFIYAHSNRFSRMFFSDYTESQLAARLHILGHIKKLAKVYGRVTFSPEAVVYLKHFWEVKHDSGHRNNYSEKLNYYYSRLNIHIQKLAMIVHFADAQFDSAGKCSMVISLEEVLVAEKLLAGIESKMHIALQLRSSNALAGPSKKVLSALKKHAMTFEELHVEFWEEAKEGELREMLTHLLTTDQIVLDDKYYKPTNKPATTPKPLEGQEPPTV
jgi:hypothetical protein